MGSGEEGDGQADGGGRLALWEVTNAGKAGHLERAAELCRYLGEAVLGGHAVRVALPLALAAGLLRDREGCGAAGGVGAWVRAMAVEASNREASVAVESIRCLSGVAWRDGAAPPGRQRGRSQGQRTGRMRHKP